MGRAYFPPLPPSTFRAPRLLRGFILPLPPLQRPSARRGAGGSGSGGVDVGIESGPIEWRIDLGPNKASFPSLPATLPLLVDSSSKALQSMRAGRTLYGRVFELHGVGRQRDTPPLRVQEAGDARPQRC